MKSKRERKLDEDIDLYGSCNTVNNMDMYELYDEKIHEYQTSNDINHKIIKKMLDEDYIPTTPDIEKAFFINIMSFYAVLEYCYHNILKDCDAAQKYYDRSKKTGYDFAIYHQIIWFKEYFEDLMKPVKRFVKHMNCSQFLLEKSQEVWADRFYQTTMRINDNSWKCSYKEYCQKMGIKTVVIDTLYNKSNFLNLLNKFTKEMTNRFDEYTKIIKNETNIVNDLISTIEKELNI